MLPNQNFSYPSWIKNNGNNNTNNLAVDQQEFPSLPVSHTSEIQQLSSAFKHMQSCLDHLMRNSSCPNPNFTPGFTNFNIENNQNKVNSLQAPGAPMMMSGEEKNPHIYSNPPYPVNNQPIHEAKNYQPQYFL